MIIDTNSTILGFADSRAILSELENSEIENDLKTLEELVFSIWNYDFDSLPNFEEKIIEGEKLPTTRAHNA